MSQTLPAEFVVRPYDEGDLDALDRIERLAGDACWSRSELEFFASRLDVDVQVVTAVYAISHPVGFYAVEHGDQTLYVANIAVAPEWRRRGIGSFALDSLTEMATSLRYRCIALDVQEENLAAQLLYRKAGFRVVRIRRMHYYRQDGYHMVKELG